MNNQELDEVNAMSGRRLESCKQGTCDFVVTTAIVKRAFEEGETRRKSSMTYLVDLRSVKHMQTRQATDIVTVNKLFHTNRASVGTIVMCHWQGMAVESSRKCIRFMRGCFRGFAFVPAASRGRLGSV